MSPRKLRIFISLVVFLLTLLAFLGAPGISAALHEILLRFQFTPALFGLVLGVGLVPGVGFFLLVLAGLVFGRVYCSFLCPLGALQDILIRISRGALGVHGRQKSHDSIRYSILAITAGAAIFGSVAMVNLLDPFSLFGRIAAHLFKTMALLANNLAGSALEPLDVYALTYRMQHVIPASILAATLLSVALIAAFAVISGRAYCNTICPVGAIWGVLSRFSLLGFVIDKEKCKGCGVCEGVCKAGCIDADAMEIDATRCIACFNCVDACPKGAAIYAFQRNHSAPRPWAPSKRRFLLGAAAVGGAMLPLVIPDRPTAAAAASEPGPITPPGSTSQAHFLTRCTACHLCVSVCPTNVIAPAFLEYGLSGVMQPRLDFLTGHCDFNCNACGQVCPTGAITPLTLAVKQRIRVGTASLNKDKCVIHVKKKHCGACGEACPTHAIHPVEKGRILFPRIEPKHCIGCGACELACPTKPKAISVTSVPVHEKAEKYIHPSLPAPMETEGKSDFPF